MPECSAPGPAQESVGSTALARAPRPRVSQPSAGQVRSAGVRTERFIGSPSEARVNRWVAAALTSLMPVAVPETWDRRSAQVRLLVPRTTTGAGREDEAVSETDAVGTAAASAEPTIVRIMPMTTSSTRTYTTARTRRCWRRRGLTRPAYGASSPEKCPQGTTLTSSPLVDAQANYPDQHKHGQLFS